MLGPYRAIKNNSVETLAVNIYDIPSIKPPRKCMEEDCFLAPMLRLANSSALNLFCSETLHERSSRCTGQAGRPIKKTTLCKKVTELPGWTSSLIGQKIYFWSIEGTDFYHYRKNRWPENISTFRLVAPGVRG